MTEDTVTEGNRETLSRQVVTHEKLDDLAERLGRIEAALSGDNSGARRQGGSARQP